MFALKPHQMHLAVIQPTPFCNIDCKYCYLPHRSTTHRISQETLARSFRFLLREPDRLIDPFVIAWHAGEPLAMPIDFYKSAFELLERLAPASPRIENWFQTNATLIDDNWCELINRWDVKIGVSVDGPQWLHDSNRIDRSGRGTFEKVLRGIELLKSHGIDFATVGVLSEQSLNFPEEIWRFYRALGAKSLAFNFEDVEGVHVNSSLRAESCFSRAQGFFEKLLFLRNSEAPDVFIRELDYFLDGFPQWRQEFRRIENAPLGIVGIAWNGDVSTFSPELIGVKHPHYGDFVFGNVNKDTLDTILDDPKFQTVHRQINLGIEKCKANCEYFSVCGGGQPSNKLYQRGTFDAAETPACQLRIQAVANVALNFIEKQQGLLGLAGQSIRQRISVLRSCMSAVPEAKAGLPGAA
jgi:uncharacterized protein